ncbi:MAG: metallophosphoesterase [Candidatus Dormibacteraeota bacterium]|nr:metallophosphoesterase [Candidatus Dormibacteraeota bacterium]
MHGDLQRLFAALRAYPADAWRTVFLGDLVDGGPFGVGALRFARDRPQSEVLLGNHEVAMLSALRDPARIPSWLGLGGELHDLEELRRDEPLQAWLRSRPLLLQLVDGTLAQHADTDAYSRLLDLDRPEAHPVEAINQAGRRLLEAGGEDRLWEVMTPRRVFQERPASLERWLALTGARRVVHGHSPHSGREPLVYAGGRALNFDGGFGRWGARRNRKRTPDAASVGPLPPGPERTA